MNRNLPFVAIALLTWGFGEGLFFNFQPIYLKSLGSNEQQIGLILGAFGAAMAITHIPAGSMADRLGRRPLLFAAWIMGFIATIIMAVARELPLFVFGMLLYGLTAFVASPLSSYVTAARGKWSITTALSMTTVTYNTGMVLGPVTGGWIGDHFGLRTIYSVSAIIFFVSTLCILFIQKQPIDSFDVESPPPGLSSNFRLVGYIGIVAFAVFAMYLAQPLTPNFLEDVRHLSLSNVGIIFTIGALGNALLAIFLGRTKPYGGFLLAQGMVAAFAFLIWRSISLPFLALGYFLLGGFRAAQPLALAQARELVHDSQMGLTYGIMETVKSVIFILTPPLAGFIYQIDPEMVYPLALGLIAVSIIISFIFPRRLVGA